MATNNSLLESFKRLKYEGYTIIFWESSLGFNENLKQNVCKSNENPDLLLAKLCGFDEETLNKIKYLNESIFLYTEKYKYQFNRFNIMQLNDFIKIIELSNLVYNL